MRTIRGVGLLLVLVDEGLHEAALGDHGDALGLLQNVIVDQAGDDEGLAGADGHGRFALAGRDGGDEMALPHGRLAEVDRSHRGADTHPQSAGPELLRQEAQA